jgi:Alginate lyase
MLVGLELGRQVAAAALLAVSSVAPNADPTPLPTSGTAAAGSPCETAPAGSTPAADPLLTVSGRTGGTEDATGTAPRHPGQLVDLDDWKLTLPVGDDGPQEIVQPALATYSDAQHFHLDRTGRGVVFRATVGGTTTENSSYPRSELREMDGAEEAAWSSTTGTHAMDLCQAITETPVAKPHVVSAQIHDGDDDVLQIRLEGQRLMVQYDDGEKAVDLDPAYRLGTAFHVRIVAAPGGVQVLYNGERKADLPLRGTGWYWKAGAYVQSNTSKGDSADAAGEVVVYALRLDHGDGAATGAAAGAGGSGADAAGPGSGNAAGATDDGDESDEPADGPEGESDEDDEDDEDDPEDDPEDDSEDDSDD